MNNDDLNDKIVINVNRPVQKKKQKKKGKKKQVAKKAALQNMQNLDEHKKQNNKKNVKKKSKKKAEHKRRNTVLIIMVIIIAIIAFLLSSDMFKITEVEVTGISGITEEEILEIANVDSYKNIFWIRKGKLEEQLKDGNAYVESAEITKQFPNKLTIDVKERVPKYMLQFADSYVYINNQGYMLEISTENIGLPIILGFTTDLSNIEAGNRLDIDDLKQMETIIKIVETANVHDIGQYITKIDVSDTKNYTLILESEGKTVYIGDASDLNTRMLYLSGILEETKGEEGEIFLNMDLNTDNAYFREKT